MNHSLNNHAMPLWRQIQQKLKQEIFDGVHEPGERLPTELSLAKRFGVNRHTVRHAVTGLVELGIIRVEQGRGMFVQEHVLFYPISKRTRFTETVEKQNRSRGRRIVSTDTVKANSRISESLRILRGRPVIQLVSISEVDDRPVSVSSNYFDKSRFPDMAKYALETLSITESLNRCGIYDYFRKSTRVTTRMPTRAEAESLKQPHTRPVLKSESIDMDENGDPIGYAETLWAGERVKLVFDTTD